MLWLIEWLPEDSAFYASQRGGPEHRPWPLQSVLAAATVNTLMGANWQRSGGKGPKPKPITPPQPKAGGGRRTSLREWRNQQISAAQATQRRLRRDGGG